jgi:prepilin-type N-terminal cleavage/methylation domain-containing protein
MLIKRHGKSRAFSLIELVIVVVIIGIIAAIAIPRMSRGATGANDNALAGNLAVLRKAIDLYQAEHDGLYPTTAAIVAQLTTYSDASGAAQAAKDATHIFGPYLRAVPPMTAPGAPRKGSSGIAAADAANIGWIYDPITGTIKANTTTEADASGKLYNTY